MEILGAIVAESCKWCCSLLCTHIGFAANFKDRHNDLVREMKQLSDQRETVNQTIQAVRFQKVPAIGVERWLKEVEEMETKVTSITEELGAQTGTGLHESSACCNNCHSRYKFSKKAVKVIADIKALTEVGKFPGGMVIDIPQPAVEELPTPLILDRSKAQNLQNQIMGWLREGEIGSIGVWGMGGVGKTTLLKNVNNLLKEEIAQTDKKEPLFDVVIWVAVSKDLSFSQIQSVIARRLNLQMLSDQIEEERMATTLFNWLQRMKRFLIILDDAWERIDLDKLGVPQRNRHSGSTLLLTTRSLNVCREMMVEKMIEVETLDEEEAWRLFCEHAGPVVDLQDIRPFAEAVSIECHRLPLALVTVGRAMRSKTMTQLWKDALRELQSSIVPDVKGMEKEVFLPLKWSYELLEGTNAKPCFLYCCLFPEDFSIGINALISHWIAEGYIDENKLTDSFNRGLALLETLKNSCMLGRGEKEGTVKMHDLIRGLAIWISSTPQGHGKFTVRAGAGLKEWPVKKIDEDTGKVSLMQNFINQLPFQPLNYPDMTTLMMQDNPLTGMSPDGLFPDMKNLRVLDLSITGLRYLPNSISDLVNLVALYLCDCQFLEELPSLGALKRLQILDLKETGLKELPNGMEELDSLRELNLNGVKNLKVIRNGLVPNLHHLEALYMHNCPCEWGTKITSDGIRGTLEELASLDRLASLDIKIEDHSCLNKPLFSHLVSTLQSFSIRSATLASLDHSTSVNIKIEDLSCLNEADFSHLWSTWQSFCFRSGTDFDSNALTVEYSSSPSRGRQVIIQGVGGVLPRKVQAMLTQIDSLDLTRCSGMKTFLPFVGTGDMGTLKSLCISSCDQMRDLVYGEEFSTLYPFGSLEELTLLSLPKLLVVWNIRYEFMARESLNNLKRLHIENCPKLKIISTDGTHGGPKNLEEIFVSGCRELEDLIMMKTNTFPRLGSFQRLRVLRLEHLWNLRSIFSGVFSLPSLQEFRVIDCPNLTLPPNHQFAPTIQVIEVERHLWDGLHWNEGAKSAYEPFLREPRI